MINLLAPFRAFLKIKEVLLLLMLDKGAPASWAIHALAFQTNPANSKAFFFKKNRIGFSCTASWSKESQLRG